MKQKIDFLCLRYVVNLVPEPISEIWLALEQMNSIYRYYSIQLLIFCHMAKVLKILFLYLWIVLSCTTNFSWLSHNVYYIILHQVQLRFTVNFMFEMRGHCHEAMTVKIFQGAHKSSTSKSPFLYNSNILFWISKNKWSGHYEP